MKAKDNRREDRLCGNYPKTYLYTLVSIILIVGLGVAVYANSLKGEFLWDDEYLIKENVFIKNPSYISDIFTSHIAAGSGKPSSSYRPLQTLSYMLDYSIWKLDEKGYHITNLILHILTALCIFWFINVLYEDKLLSFLTSALFVVHPIHTEAVSYISGRADSLALLFMLFSFLLYIKYVHSGRKSLCVLSTLSFICALFSKESSLILPVLLLIYHYSFRRPLKTKGLLSISIAATAYILLRLTVLKNILSYVSPPTTILERIPGFFTAIIDYIRLLVLPIGLHMEYGDSIFRWTEPKVIAGVLIIVFLAVYLIRKGKERGLVSFSILWFFITLLPSSNIYPVNAYMAEHWLYLPSIGFFLIIANAIRALYAKKELRVLAIALIATILGFYSSLTISQNRYWRDPVFFYERTSKYASNNLRVYNNLGAIYYNKGRNNEAIKMYNKALKINPRHIEAYNNLGVLYFNMDAKEKALGFLKKAISINPRYAQAYSNLGNVYIKKGMLEEAIASYKKALSINPNYAAAHSNIALAYFNNKDYELAVEHCDEAIKLGHKVSQGFLKSLQPYRKESIR